MTQPDDPGVVPYMDAQKVRLLRVLGRHTRPSDNVLDDRAFMFTVIDRWERSLAEPIIDIGE